MKSFEIIVTGGGPAGLAAACLVAKDGRRVGLITGRPNGGEDPRTIALMQPQIRLLAHLGIWPHDLRDRVSPLNKLRLVDDTGSPIHAPTLTFDPQEIGEEVFGWNIPLAHLNPALKSLAASLNIEIIPCDVTAARISESVVHLETSAGEFSTPLVLAADGRKSLLREAAGIKCDSWNYDQVALATSFDHTGEHQGISTEYHKRAGPFTTVPLPGKRSSLVWMEHPKRVAELMAMPDAELATEIQLASHGDLGLVSGIGLRRAFPMAGLIARSFAAKRIMLVGETGHVVPPIGAQGLNMSLRDAAQAAELIAGEADPGASRILTRYDALRRQDVGPRQEIIHLMNRSLLAGFVPFDVARAAGLEVLARFGPLRRYVMQQGLGPLSSLPKVMRNTKVNLPSGERVGYQRA
jgi:2-octaprenyl-6-methoxyphenol hydroxylase